MGRDDTPARQRHPGRVNRSGRRQLLVAGLASLAVPAWAQRMLLTPAQTEGPFYPDRMPTDQDADLTTVAGRSGRARGEAGLLSGRVLDASGKPLSGVRVEIWQCDANGRYLHSADRNGTPDPDFQGFGAASSGEDGAWRFRTIRPVAYPGRTPHIHFKLVRRGTHLLTTQMYIAGHPQNERDGLFRSVDRAGQQALSAAFEQDGAGWQARWDIVLGVTPPQA